MARVVVETSTISDAMNKAARVSPKEFNASEAVSTGILIEYDEETKNVFVRATDLEVFYRQQVAGLEVSGTGEWRISKFAARFIDKLPKSRGSVVELSDEKVPGQLAMTREHSKGETFASYPLIIGSQFPYWEPYDEVGGAAVTSFSSSVDAVAWAASTDDGFPELQGVYLDGWSVMATNRYVAARVPLGIPSLVDMPVTIPHRALAGVVHHSGDALVTKTQRGIGVTPDEFSQVEVIRFSENRIEKLKLPDQNSFSSSITVKTDDYREVCDRIFTVLKKDEKGKVNIMATKDSMMFTIVSEAEQKMQDSIEATAGPNIPTMLTYNAMYVKDAVSNSIGQTAKIYFDEGLPEQKQFTYVQGGAGYEAWISPQREPVR